MVLTVARSWRRERLPLIPDGPIDVAPDWVCEILSPSTANKDRKIKLPLYGQLGVGNAWLIDPNAKTIEVLRFCRRALGLAWYSSGATTTSMRAEPKPFERSAVAIIEPTAPLWAW